MDVIAILNPASSSYCFLKNERVARARARALKFREFIPYDRAVTVKITVLKERESLLRESSNDNIPGVQKEKSPGDAPATG